MTAILTDASTWGDATAPTGTDIRNASGVRAHLQTLANRTRFLRDRSEPLANLAALTALAGVSVDTIRSVESYGAYQFVDTGGMLAVDGAMVLNPDVPDGVHQWVHEIFLLRNAVGGFATVAPDGKLDRAMSRGWIANVVQGGNAGDPSVTAQAFTALSGVYADASGVTATVTGPGTGSYKVIATLRATFVGAGGTGYAKLVANDGGGDVDVPLSEESFVLGANEVHKIGGTFVIPATAGSLTVRLRAKGTSGTVWLRHNACIALQMVEI